MESTCDQQGLHTRRHHVQLVVLAPAGLARLDLHPHGVAEAMRRVAAAGGDPLSLPDLRNLA